MVMDAAKYPWAHTHRIRCLCIVADAASGALLLFSGADDGTIHMWKPEGTKFVYVSVWLRKHTYVHLLLRMASPATRGCPLVCIMRRMHPFALRYTAKTCCTQVALFAISTFIGT